MTAVIRYLTATPAQRAELERAHDAERLTQLGMAWLNTEHDPARTVELLADIDLAAMIDDPADRRPALDAMAAVCNAEWEAAHLGDCELPEQDDYDPDTMRGILAADAHDQALAYARRILAGEVTL